MSEHYTSHRVESAKEVRDAENMINDHFRSWMRIFNIGSESGSRQQRRCGRAIINNYSSIPSIQGLRKDHKGNLDNDPIKGPKLRPLCAANKAPNAALANVVAKMLKAVGDNISEFVGAEVISTEQLKREFEIVNRKISEEWERGIEIASILR